MLTVGSPRPSPFGFGGEVLEFQELGFLSKICKLNAALEPDLAAQNW